MLSARLIKKLDGIEETSKRGRKVQDLFKILTNNPELWIQAYANIYSNEGAMTVGTDETTMDGFSEDRAAHIIKSLKEESYTFQPSRRVYIPKTNGKKRPLGISSGNDKLVQETIRIIMERIYEPIFSRNSHGFRPQRSCHTALDQVKREWTGVKWVIDFDIKGFFDNVDHEILIQFLEKRIDDRKFIRLIKMMLKAGYMEQWKYCGTYSGTPQGNISSPLLSNVYLSELDTYVDSTNFNRGKKRKRNPGYTKIVRQLTHLRKKIDELKDQGSDRLEIDRLIKDIKKLKAKQRTISVGITSDPDYKRLLYCRYCDDFIIGIIGSRDEAVEISSKVKSFIEEKLNLEIANDKTGIRYFKEGTYFLGYEAKTVATNRTRRTKVKGRHTNQRSLMENVTLKTRKDKVAKFCNKYGKLSPMKAKGRKELFFLSDIEILGTYNAELRGFANYYALADNVKSELNKLFYIAKMSFIKTLANKYNTKVTQIYKKYRRDGEIVVKYDVKGKIREQKLYELKHLEAKPKEFGKVDLMPHTYKYSNGTELVRRMNAHECEYCGQTEGKFEVHHAGKLANLKEGTEKWKRIMIARQRKTLILCTACHDLLHAGKLPDRRFQQS